jgi:pimeloyl-ACP methyl ester carboxylesterase
MEKIISADGTTIAYDRFGAGQPVILVGGALCDRESLRPLAEQLASDYSVVSYDRRGRGDSGDTLPYAVQREIEDLTALATASGGTTAVYGHSSGAGLALQAAAHGVPFSKVVLHEPPYGSEEDREESQALAAEVQAALTENRRADVVGLFLSGAGMPPEAVAELCADPKMVGIAHTLAYDFEVMGMASTGAVVPDDLVSRVEVPTLVLAGADSPAFMVDAARQIGDGLRNGRSDVLEGETHVVAPERLAAVLTEFFSAGGAR